MKGLAKLTSIALGLSFLMLPLMSLTAKATYSKADSDLNIDIGIGEQEPSTIVRYYFIDSSWWNEAAAESWIYLWNSGTGVYKAIFPGEMMINRGYDQTSRTNTWYFDVDTELYDMAIASRQKTNSSTGMVEDWNAQTIDIELNASFNTIVLSSTIAWKSDGNKANVTTSMKTY